MQQKKVTTLLKNVIIFCRDLEKCAGFYSDAVGLKVVNQSKNLVELKDQSNSRLILRKIDGVAPNLKGYSPVLNFQVQDFELTLQKLRNYGVQEDGEPVIEKDFKVCMFKAQNGEMLVIHSRSDETVSDSEGSADEEGQSKEDAATREIKNILRKIRV